MKENKRQKNINRIRWIARVLSFLILMLTVTLLISSALAAERESLSLVYWLLLGLWCLSAACLMAAWRWELIGSILAVIALISRELVILYLSGQILVDFWQVWLPILFPAGLFLLAWDQERQMLKDQTPRTPREMY